MYLLLLPSKKSIRALFSTCLSFFVKPQFESVRVTREPSRHRDPQQAAPQQQDFSRRILWVGTFFLRVLVQLGFDRYNSKNILVLVTVMTGATTATTTTTTTTVPTSTADFLLLLRPLISSRKMGLTTPPAACLRTCLRTRLARCCCGQAQSAYEYSLIGRTKKKV